MYFDDDDDDEPFLNRDIYHIVSRELYAMGASLDPVPPYRDVIPTHTEDGIPIRKLYVSNLPPKTSRTELFGVFAQYGFIKSCWLRMGERGPSKSPTPTYAFVTYSNPADAHKALRAPNHEKTLRGRNLTISPADSWHQPLQDADGRVRWKVHTYNHATSANTHTNTNTLQESNAPDVESTEAPTEQPETSTSTSFTDLPEPEVPTVSEDSYDILDILNNDCLTHVLSYVPLTDIIRSERVSKRWQNMVQEYLSGVRTFKTSWWGAAASTLTTAVLRRVLQRVGASLVRLHIDHHWSSLNDRTAHVVGKFCPNLEEIKVVGMHTKNWNPLIYGCKQLKSVIFASCNKLTDASLVQIAKNESSIEHLVVANNSNVTGLFLTSANTPKLTSLSFLNCYSLQGTVLSSALQTLPNMTCLRLDMCPISLWKIIPLIISKLPKLVELSLSEYSSIDCLYSQNTEFTEAMATLTELKVLNFSRNIYVTNATMKQVAQTCTQLEVLNVSGCNARKTYPGIGDESLVSICAGCRQLKRLDVSYLAALSDAGLAHAAALPRLAELTARGNPALSARPFVACMAACPELQMVDVSGCEGVCSEAALGACVALEARPRAFTLHLAGTAAANAEEMPTHKLLCIKYEDLSDPQLRPDFVDHVFDDDSDDESDFDDIYDHDDFDHFLAAEDELFMDDDFEDYDGIAYGLHGPDIILL